MPALILAAAITLSGECGPLGPPCELAVARTMANRLAHPAFPDDLAESGGFGRTGVLSAYYGRARPTASALAVAALLVAAPLALADGINYYAYSDQDRLAQGWREGQETICRAGLCLHLSPSFGGAP